MRAVELAEKAQVRIASTDAPLSIFSDLSYLSLSLFGQRTTTVPPLSDQRATAAHGRDDDKIRCRCIEP